MLSDAKVKSLKPTEKIYRVLDAEKLYIEVRPSGKKMWRYRYTLNGKSNMIGLGEYPLVTLMEARREKDNIRTMLAKGIDPSQERKQSTANAMSFREIAEEYFNEHGFAEKSSTYVRNFKKSMEKDIYPAIGKKNIKDVTSADVLAIMRNTLTRVRKQDNFGTGEVTAIQNRKFIGAVMRYAIATLRCDYDPTQAVKEAISKPDVEHARPMTKEEMRILRTKLQSYGGSNTVRNAGLLLLYSMLRTIEIRRLKWEYVNFDEKLIVFPVASKRTGQERTMKKNRMHMVPITTQMEAILKQQYEISRYQEYVFCGVYKGGAISGTTLNRMLDYIGLADVSAHDFRATASTVLNEKGYDSDWIEKQLAHEKDDKTRASYNHAQYLDQRRQMLQDWADIVDSWASNPTI